MAALLLGIGIIGISGMNKSEAGLKSVYEDRTVPLSLTAHIESKLLEKPTGHRGCPGHPHTGGHC